MRTLACLFPIRNPCSGLRIAGFRIAHLRWTYGGGTVGIKCSLLRVIAFQWIALRMHLLLLLSPPAHLLLPLRWISL